MRTIPIDDPADPRLAVYAGMRDAELAQRADPLSETAHAGLFIAEGELVVRRLIESAYPVHSVLTTPTRLRTVGDSLVRLPDSTAVYLTSPSVMESIVGFNMHRGLLAAGVRSPLPAALDLGKRAGPLVVLEDVNNHDNLGGIFRNAAALGGPDVGVLLSPRCSDPLYRKSLRVSIGCVLSVPFARVAPGAWLETLGELRTMGWCVIGLTPKAGAMPLHEAARQLGGRRVALLLGAEGPGLTDAAIGACDLLARIPMRPASPVVDSLNVHVAAGVALYALG